jgi:hypothetical protein
MTVNKMPAIPPSSRAWLIGGLLFNANLDVHGARFLEHQCQSKGVRRGAAFSVRSARCADRLT